MARVKTTARRCAPGKGKRMSKKAGPSKSRPSENGPRKPHRFRPGTVALKEIRKYQKTFDLLLPKLPFARICREIDQYLHDHQLCVYQHRFTAQALFALQVRDVLIIYCGVMKFRNKQLENLICAFFQEAAEAVITEFFEFCNNSAIYAKRQTVMIQDIKFLKSMVSSNLNSNMFKRNF